MPLSPFPLQAHLPGASRLVLGAMGFGGGWNDAPLEASHVDAAQRALHAALEAGIALFDHADIYTHGKAEASFGAVFRRATSLRDRLLLQSKCGIRFADAQGPGRYDLSAEHIERSVEASLQRLHTDRLDLLLLHRPDPLMQPDEVAGAFERLHRSGKVRHFGVSNVQAAQLQQLQAALTRPLVVNQLQISLLHAHAFEAGVTFNDAQGRDSLPWLGTLEHCQQQGIQVQAWGPLDRGWLTGSAPGDAPARVHATADRVRQLAHAHGVATEAIVLAWLLCHPAGIQPVLGTTRPDRIAACAQALQVQLSREDWYGLWVLARGRALP